MRGMDGPGDEARFKVDGDVKVDRLIARRRRGRGKGGAAEEGEEKEGVNAENGEENLVLSGLTGKEEEEEKTMMQKYSHFPPSLPSFEELCKNN